ncbi:pyoverdine biosynthesis protein PvdE [Labrys miyagiensis]|uniref:Pyoverdine biosynthesis protein PvdE n=1 Tax=Labrys miyagiensis TaxID=346912 RepID=A0ABQ6CSU1_9HYPH|nr:cyclic peptide export ABC transporter [Labrys miyagiensis]GLS22853.1 pyoverdine biosynthesis protein PvdE [Labrys miyagiensis]
MTRRWILTAASLAEALRLLRPFGPIAALATLVGGASGIATAWLLAIINRSLHDPVGLSEVLASFVALCALSAAGTALAGTLNSTMGQRLVAELRKEIAARILRTPLAVLEAHRAHRLMSVLTTDIDNLSVFTFSLSGYAVAAATTIGSFAYLWILSRSACGVAVLALGLGIVMNNIARTTWIRDYERVRTAQDDLHSQYRAITDGAKELKMSRARRGRVHGVLLAGAADRIAALKSHAMRLFWVADGAGSAIFFAVIGLLVIARHRLGVTEDALSGVVIVLLYVKGPITLLASAVPEFDQARIAFHRIAQLSADIADHEPNVSLEATDGAKAYRIAFNAIELRKVTYTFPASGSTTPFMLGPIDLSIRHGELLFVIGDNGSGKTTLIKLLLGLYAPQSGFIQVDGQTVTAETRDDYRQLFSTVFSDYYLFGDLAYGTVPSVANANLERLGLAGKVRVEDERFSTIDLSTGQRKRLALVHAFLESRPILVTDEWAADQDPDFRRLFYEDLLPALKATGTTLIVVSHDDRYFHVADRVLRLKEGRLI